MKTMTTVEMLQKLQGIKPGDLVFVSYISGRAPTARALEEAKASDQTGICPRHYIGSFQDVNMNSRGEVTMTVFVDNRDNAKTGEVGAFRTFNPNVGQLLTLERLS